MTWEFDIKYFKSRNDKWGKSISGEIERAMIEEYDRLEERLARDENDADRQTLNELRERMIQRMWTISEELRLADSRNYRLTKHLYSGVSFITELDAKGELSWNLNLLKPN